MPHQCVKCGKFYTEGSNELLKGCVCGGKFFFFVNQKHLDEAKKITESLTDEDKLRIEKDVLDIVGIKDEEEDVPVVLDLESINILKPGKYSLDLVHLFRGLPLVYRLEEGKYIIDLASSFQLGKNDDEEKI